MNISFLGSTTQVSVNVHGHPISGSVKNEVSPLHCSNDPLLANCSPNLTLSHPVNISYYTVQRLYIHVGQISMRQSWVLSRPGNIFYTVNARYNNWFIVLLLLVGTTTVGNNLFDELFGEDAQTVSLWWRRSDFTRIQSSYINILYIYIY